MRNICLIGLNKEKSVECVILFFEAEMIKQVLSPVPGLSLD